MSVLKQRERLCELQEVDFVLVELNLYLDTHPGDAQAIDQYNYYASKRKKISRSYEEEFGPLMNFGHSKIRGEKGWDEAPWPWQL